MTEGLTMVVDYQLVCERKYFKNLINTMFLIGKVVTKTKRMRKRGKGNKGKRRTKKKMLTREMGSKRKRTKRQQ